MCELCDLCGACEMCDLRAAPLRAVIILCLCAVASAQRSNYYYARCVISAQLMREMYNLSEVREVHNL